ncbi:TetR/AcrR family transcriptional regulator [Amycolatopsis pithecellobii]|uniref:TetR family transcriptional regulator n=1 Tax=Amycolatopsis pithecellobii TaxID=664692 RepID=A0A6N7YZD0_9PSEU|nr:TetR/AcrR family transcriptional regulator [Amycolatopsis pithecellobii]MTD54263.1 TetR family transcriptional regulator [Amycolatopsis pithecellobii]
MSDEQPRTRTKQAGAGGSEVLWLRDTGPRPPRRNTPLTLERIITAAIAELDAAGAERLTMRKLAERLEVTSTALYWHVATKEDLLDLALDHVVGEVPVPAPDSQPRAGLRTVLTGWRAAMLAHPWSPGLLGRPMLGPNVLARTEFIQAMLVRAGLSGVDLAAATRTLAGFVIGASMADATWRRLDDPGAIAKVRAHILDAAELYPTLSTSGFVDAAWSDDDLFVLGLERVLDLLLPA